MDSALGLMREIKSRTIFLRWQYVHNMNCRMIMTKRSTLLQSGNFSMSMFVMRENYLLRSVLQGITPCQRFVSSSPSFCQKGVLYVSPTEFNNRHLVSTPIGCLQDISRRALDVLQSVDVIAAEDTRTTHFLLSQQYYRYYVKWRFNIQRPLVSLNQENEASKVNSLIEQLKNGRTFFSLL